MNANKLGVVALAMLVTVPVWGAALMEPNVTPKSSQSFDVFDMFRLSPEQFVNVISAPPNE
jgi:hypothetical protein